MLFHVSFQRAAQLEILIKTLVAIEIVHPHMILPTKLASFGDSDPPERDEHKVLNCRWPRKCRTFLHETSKPLGQFSRNIQMLVRLPAACDGHVTSATNRVIL